MLRNFLRRFDQLRRQQTQGASACLFGLMGRDTVLLNERLPADQVKRILVLRNNKRIGNMYFLLPFLNRLRDAYPDASIDLMVISDSHARIFQAMSLNRIWVSHFAFATALTCFKTLRQCRQEPYDLLFMPHPSSTDLLIGRYIRARNKISFASPRVNAVYPQSIDAPHASAHAAKTPLALIDAANSKDKPVNHLMTLTAEERETAKQQVENLRADAVYTVAYFRGARGKKIISNANWLRIREQFEQASTAPIVWVEILSPDVTEPLVPGTATWQSKDFRALGAFLNACDLFICGDTGPLHLADAAGARCVGLFTATTPEHYGCMGEHCINVTDLSALNPSHILQGIDATRANLAQQL